MGLLAGHPGLHFLAEHRPMVAFASEKPEPVIAFVIPGRPFAWRRARTFGRRHFEDPEQRSWKGMAQLHMLAATRGRSRPVFPEGAVEIVVRACWPSVGAPLRQSRRRPRWRPSRPDADNAFKVLADCSQGILVADDAQYALVHIEKWTAGQGEAARTEVEVRPLVEPGEAA